MEELPKRVQKRLIKGLLPDQEPDPLAGQDVEPGKPVEIEKLEKKREEQEKARRHISFPDLSIDISLIALFLLAFGLLVVILAILLMPDLPPPWNPYTWAIKGLLLAVALSGTGTLLLWVALRSGGRRARNIAGQ